MLQINFNYLKMKYHILIFNAQLVVLLFQFFKYPKLFM